MISPGNILIVQIGKLGDMILTTPLFREIKKLFPASKLTVLASERNYEIVQADANVDSVLIYPGNLFKRLALFIKLKFLKFGLWIDTKNEYSKTSALLVKLNKPSRSLGFNFNEKVFSVSLSNYSGTHAVDINLSPLKYFNSNFEFLRKPVLNTDKQYYLNIEKYITFSGKKALFNISAGNKIRHWETRKWISLALMLSNFEQEYRVFVISDTADEGIADEIVREAANVNIISLKLGLFEKFALISKMDVVISPDTSIIHAASAFNVPVIGLYTNVEWNTRKFAPLSDKHIVLASNSENSINSIGENEVFEALNRII
jgi:ADP-heptose:LPS heptosyltransferase